MKSPMITYKSASKVRKFVRNSKRVANEKVFLRRLARHKDKNALRRGDYDAAPSRGQSSRDVV